MVAFREALQDCSLNDLGYRGSLFTWTNCQEGDGLTKERLDRAVANREWCERYQNSDLWILAAQSSDHKPICLCMGGCDEMSGVSSKRFKIEASWMIDADYKQVVDDAWVNGGLGGSAMQMVQQKLAYCQTELSSWSSRKFGNASKTLKDKTK
jgi:hypothetical protein